MTYYDPGFEFDKDIDVEVDFDFDSYVDVDFYKDVDIDVRTDVCVDIDGNQADFAIDVEAYGDDSYADLELNVLVTDELSSIVAVGTASVD
ncbi:hypothetical protein HGP14_18245 [Rhizobium sp. P32RR-XVIII]|jgi:hypothetical protein|uniref:hypothetical protein n=1 Tax=Rhizobium sp. P32RR-XVIII TaxID=2726738 RepID=UPI001456E0D4|nr:hypothetical protein [Rhizobium sp. P32RR-XVIII]NLS05289.1 hypothetical protein [Rhizobium sp. P32RR-XVIII]